MKINFLLLTVIIIKKLSKKDEFRKNVIFDHLLPEVDYDVYLLEKNLFWRQLIGKNII